MKLKLLLIDNYDSSPTTWWQAFLVLGAEVEVYRNRRDHGRGKRWRVAPSHLVDLPGPKPGRHTRDRTRLDERLIIFIEAPCSRGRCAGARGDSRDAKAHAPALPRP